MMVTKVKDSYHDLKDVIKHLDGILSIFRNHQRSDDDVRMKTTDMISDLRIMKAIVENEARRMEDDYGVLL